MSETDKLIEIMLKRDEELAPEREQLSREIRNLHARQREEKIISVLRRQQKCSHRKGDLWQVTVGSKPRLPLFRFDFNVTCHTYINGSKRIRCNTCGRIWTNGDADFDEALKMVQNNTTQQWSAFSSSEVVPPLARNLKEEVYVGYKITDAPK